MIQENQVGEEGLESCREEPAGAGDRQETPNLAQLPDSQDRACQHQPTDRSIVAGRSSGLFRGLRNKPLSVRFWALVDRREPDACWPWMGDRTQKDGYGRIQVGSKVMAAHRLSLELAIGRPLARHEVVLHSCDNRLCVRPDHLSAGSIADNNADMRRKDRHSRGERAGHAKVSEADANAIRVRRLNGERAKDIAADFGITDREVYYIAKGHRWAHSSPLADERLPPRSIKPSGGGAP